MDKMLLKINHQSSTIIPTNKEHYTMIYEKILKEKQRLEKQAEILQSQINKLPAGKMIYFFLKIKFLFVMNAHWN